MMIHKRKKKRCKGRQNKAEHGRYRIGVYLIPNLFTSMFNITKHKQNKQRQNIQTGIHEFNLIEL